MKQDGGNQSRGQGCNRVDAQPGDTTLIFSLGRNSNLRHRILYTGMRDCIHTRTFFDILLDVKAAVAPCGRSWAVLGDAQARLRQELVARFMGFGLT